MKIVALGGGTVDENSVIDRFIVEYSGKERPRFLFLPTASGDSGHYINSVKRSYKHLGCSADALCLLRAEYSPDELERRVEAADIIYVGGGDTLRMFSVWERTGMIPLLRRAAERGAVMCGVSAGAMCWFSQGYSDCDFHRSDVENPTFRLIDGFGFIPAVCCPHYDEEGRDAFDRDCADHALPGIALENGVALVKNGTEYSVIRNEESKRAWLFTHSENAIKKSELTARFQL